MKGETVTRYYDQGRYKLKVIGAALGESSGGNPQVEIGIEILGFADPQEGYVTVQGPQQTVYLSLTEGTLGTPQNPGWVWQTLKDLGFIGPSFSDLQPLIGQVRDGELKYETWEGVDRGKWTIYRARGSEPMRPMDRSAVRKVDAKFGSLLKLMKGSELPPPSKQEPEAAPGPTPKPQRKGRVRETVPTEERPPIPGVEPGDDIPF